MQDLLGLPAEHPASPEPASQSKHNISHEEKLTHTEFSTTRRLLSQGHEQAAALCCRDQGSIADNFFPHLPMNKAVKNQLKKLKNHAYDDRASSKGWRQIWKNGKRQWRFNKPYEPPGPLFDIAVIAIFITLIFINLIF